VASAQSKFAAENDNCHWSSWAKVEGSAGGFGRN
jgi:hypothetical protein